jgi:CSLREA domain-containing protein
MIEKRFPTFVLLISLALLTTLVLSLRTPPIARAATITVNSTADTTADDGQCTLREAIIAANTDTASGSVAGECAAGSDDDSIDLTGIAGTINLTGPLPDISRNVALYGPGADNLTVRRDTGGYYRIFTVSAGAYVDISGLTISNGLVVDDLGGGIRNSGTVVLNHSIVSNNGTSTNVVLGGHGGGIYSTGTLELNHSSVVSNSITTAANDSYGGGIYSAGTLLLFSSTVSHNNTYGHHCHGGGIRNAGTLTMDNSTVSHNSASTGSAGDGGGIHSVGGSSSVTLNNSTVSNNRSNGGGSGGGLWNSDGSNMELTNSTVSGNVSSRNGGGINNTGNSTLTLNNSTISHNNASDSGGGIWNDGDSLVSFKNSVIAENTASSAGPDCRNIATFTSGDYNLVGDNSGCPFAPQTNDQVGVNSLLGPLQDNGGPTETCALLSGSPAINAIPVGSCTDHQGMPITTDQRGVLRPQGAACDMGAYEVQVTTHVFTVTKTADTADGSCDATDCSLREAIIAANAMPGPDIVHVPAGIYTLTISGADEDAAATGDLDIADDLTISGAGAVDTIIDGGEIDRVFHVTGAIALEMTSVTIQHGSLYGDGGGIANYSGGTVDLTSVTIQHGSARGYGGGIVNYSGTVHLTDSTVRGNRAFITEGGGTGGGIYNGGGGKVTLSNSTVSDNVADLGFGGGIRTTDADSIVTLRNTVLMENQGGALGVTWGARATLLHTTLARNSGEGVYVAGGTAVFTNTIVADHAVGVRVENGGAVTMTRTLWDGNTTNTSGPVSETGYLDGPAWFAPDGYHLTRYSAALAQGVDAGVTDDVDGQGRPLPAGTAPDLGADEYPYNPGEEFVAEKVAFLPQWIVQPEPLAGRLQQRYLIRFFYGSPEPSPPDLTVAVTDTLPAELAFEAETHVPPMDFQQQGNRLTWQSQQPIHKGQAGGIQLAGVYDHPEPGRTLTNTARLSAGPWQFTLPVTSAVPIVAPLIVSPGKGEICPDPSGNVQVRGAAQGGAIVRLYENGSEKGQVTVPANGVFTMTYSSSLAGTSPVTLTAQACAPGDPSRCSQASQVVNLTPSQSFWCPQRSTWEATRGSSNVAFRFRDNAGKFSTQNWVISSFPIVAGSTLRLYACNCRDTSTPSSVWVIADGVRYDATGSHPWYTFAITGGAHDVTFYAQCGMNVESSTGHILWDPDGYVFDVTQGFDPVSPTLHAVKGVTVTAMVSLPQWGGWVPWPAQLYNNQVNPQVTGADGYFAFFTPPGFYYLQVEGIPGYQPWRSPVIEVITQIVHVNVPYTPWPHGNISQVTLTADGPTPAVITVPVGSAVEWVAELSGLVPPQTLIQLIENPELRPLSARNPLSDRLGWDGGMMEPGRAYRRQFTTLGTYPYTDGTGHSGQVVVTRQYIYLPVVMRAYP